MENIVIIGGGPAGLAAAIYNARAGLNPLVIEGTTGGGQLAQTTDVENYPGFPNGILGPELVSSFRKQAERFGTRFVTDNVKKINPKSEIRNPCPKCFAYRSRRAKQISNSTFQILNSNGSVIETRSVLVATGAEAMWLGIPSEQKLRGKGVSACATCDGFFFRNKTVGVVGGGDTALEEALTLTKFATKVYIIHRRDSFRASKIMQERVLKHPKIEVMWNSAVSEVLGEMKVEGIKLHIQHPKSETTNISLDGLFIAIGHKPSTEFLAGSGVLLDNKGYVITSGARSITNNKFLIDLLSKQSQDIDSMKLEVGNFNFDFQFSTSISGIFAAGDCVDYVYQQAATAVGMGVAAGLEIERYLEYRI